MAAMNTVGAIIRTATAKAPAIAIRRCGSVRSVICFNPKILSCAKTDLTADSLDWPANTSIDHLPLPPNDDLRYDMV